MEAHAADTGTLKPHHAPALIDDWRAIGGLKAMLGTRIYSGRERPASRD